MWWRVVVVEGGGCGGRWVAGWRVDGYGGGWVTVVEGEWMLWKNVGGCGGQWLWLKEGGCGRGWGLRGVAIGAEWVDGHGREWRTGDYSGDSGWVCRRVGEWVTGRRDGWL